MTNHFEENPTLTAQEMKVRYQRAQSLMQGIFSKKIAINTTLIPHWIGDSDCFWYERETRQGREFRLVDANQRSNEVAFDHRALAEALQKASKQQVSADDLPISKINLSLSPLKLTFDAFAKRWTFSQRENICTEVETYPDDWLISHDGQKAAFVRDHNLWLRKLSNGEEKALTQDGEAFYNYASASSAWGIKITTQGPPEALWSPDSRRLFTLQMDTRAVNTFPMIQHVPTGDNVRPTLTGADRRLAFPGDEQVDQYRFLAIDIETGQQQNAQYSHCPVFPNATGFFTVRNGWWGEDSRHAYFIHIERGGHLARLVAFDTHTGSTKVLIEESSPGTFFKLRLDTRDPGLIVPMPNSDELIWYSERSGWAHLYLYNLKTGELKHPITKGEWLVWEILHIDSKRRELLIQTANRVDGRNAYYRDICRVNIDSGELTPLQSTDHHYVVFDPMSEVAANLKITRDIWGASGVSLSGRYLVTTRSRADEIPVSLLLNSTGKELLIVEIADIFGLPDGWQWPEPVQLKAADNSCDIYGLVFRPSNFSPEQSYPILDVSWTHKEGCVISVGSLTNNPIGNALYLTMAAYAELGFIVVDLYGRGTSGRDRVFSADKDPWLPDSHNQADRIAGIRQLAERYPYIDLNRVGVGITGISSPACISGLLGYPDFYKVGVGHNVCTDTRMMAAFFAETFADLPSSAHTRQPIDELAGNLQGKLLLMAGMLDSITPAAATFRLVEALQEANKDFDLLILPNDGHVMSSYATRRAWDYLVRHLLGVEPPKTFKLTTGIDILMQEINAKRDISHSD